MWLFTLISLLATSKVFANTSSLASVDLQISEAMKTVNSLLADFMSMLPKLLIAIIVFLLFLFLSWGVRKFVERSMEKGSGRRNVKKVLGRLTRWCTIILGLIISLAIVSPSITPAKLLNVLGLGGVAIGFAFKDVLQNYVAGILILLNQPFRIRDQVIIGGYEGTVENIDTRATVLRTYDGERVLVPNGQVYTNPMVVLTAYNERRSCYDVGIGYGDDITEAARIILHLMKTMEGIKSTPAPDVLVAELGSSTVNLRARWWTDPRRADVLEIKSELILKIKNALDQASIDMPFPTQVLLLHDQTEETDGNRRAQREGWPPGKNPPRSRFEANRLDAQKD